MQIVIGPQMLHFLISRKHHFWVEDWKIASLTYNSEVKDFSFIYILNILYSINDDKVPRYQLESLFFSCLCKNMIYSKHYPKHSYLKAYDSLKSTNISLHKMLIKWCHIICMLFIGISFYPHQNPFM